MIPQGATNKQKKSVRQNTCSKISDAFSDGVRDRWRIFRRRFRNIFQTQKTVSLAGVELKLDESAAVAGDPLRRRVVDDEPNIVHPSEPGRGRQRRARALLISSPRLPLGPHEVLPFAKRKGADVLAGSLNCFRKVTAF